MITARELAKTADPSLKYHRLSLSTRNPSPQVIEAQIKTKIDTFLHWDAYQYLHSTKTMKLGKERRGKPQEEEGDIMKTLLKFVNQMKRKQSLLKGRKLPRSNVEQKLMSENKRERFVKMSNPLQFIEYYTKNHKFEPTEHQKVLINKLVQIKALLESMQSLHLEKVLSQIYELMNIVVDFNELRLLVVVVVLAADICYQAKDFNRAVYFYDQAKLAAEISRLTEIVTQSLVGLSKVCFDLGLTGFSIKFLKKALAYSWQQNDRASETQIYDILGKNYCLQGKMSEAKYYHERFAQNYIQKESSAIRKIYIEIIKDDQKNRNFRLYTQNVDLLFLETICLPIWNFDKVPPIRTTAQFSNFIDGQSPRKNLVNKRFDIEYFEDAQFQVKTILQKSEFKKQMPNPNLQALYTPSHRYGKKKRQVQFSRTLQFHEITGTKIQIGPPQKARKYSLEKQIQIMMADKADPHWYLKMSESVKRQRMQKLGSLKDPVRRTHLKTQQRKRTLSSQSENIGKSINKAILSWISPTQ